MLSETSRAWTPSCRSRSMRRSSAAWVSMLTARVSASSSTRLASRERSVGASSQRARVASARISAGVNSHQSTSSSPPSTATMFAQVWSVSSPSRMVASARWEPNEEGKSIHEWETLQAPAFSHDGRLLAVSNGYSVVVLDVGARAETRPGEAPREAAKLEQVAGIEGFPDISDYRTNGIFGASATSTANPDENRAEDARRASGG